MSRVSPNVVQRLNSPNASSRNGVKPKLIVLHSTESDNHAGSSVDLRGVAGYLCTPSVQASAHVITDGDGNSIRLVRDEFKAWHCAGYNSASLGIEQVGRAASEHWRRDEYRETARWIALWSARYGIPIRHGRVALGKVVLPGIVTHKDLGAIGGGHVDPGPRYDFQAVLNLAKFYKAHL